MGRPPPADVIEHGEWAHGWQYFASSVSEYHFRESTVLRQFMSQSPGPLAIPLWWWIFQRKKLHRPEFTVEPELFHTLILERLRLPLAVATLSASVACPHSGRLLTRTVAPERTLARICRGSWSHRPFQRQIEGYERSCEGG